MPAPTITALPTAPDRTQPGSTFSAQAAAFVNALAGFETEVNAFGTWLNSNALISYSWGAGTVGAPSIHNATDTDTGIYWPDADTLAVSTGGTQRFVIDSSGNVGIGTVSPDTKLHVNGSNGDLITISTDDNISSSELGISFIHDRDGSNWQGGRIYSQRSGTSNEFNLAFEIGRNGVHTDAMFISAADSAPGYVGIGTTAPSELLDVNGDAIRVRTSQTPASAGATGTAGVICWDSNYVYVCVATNTWKRAALSTW